MVAVVVVVVLLLSHAESRRMCPTTQVGTPNLLARGTFKLAGGGRGPRSHGSAPDWKLCFGRRCWQAAELES